MRERRRNLSQALVRVLAILTMTLTLTLFLRCSSLLGSHALLRSLSLLRSLCPSPVTEKYRLMKDVHSLLRETYEWDPAWIDGVTAAIRFKKLETSVDKTKAAIDYLVSLGIPVHRVENMVSINKMILARTQGELEETVDYIEKKGAQGEELVRFLTTNPVILRYGPSADGNGLALRRAGGLDSTSRARVVKDGRGVLQCVYFREGVVLGASPITMTVS